MMSLFLPELTSPKFKLEKLKRLQLELDKHDKINKLTNKEGVIVLLLEF